MKCVIMYLFVIYKLLTSLCMTVGHFALTLACI